MRAALLVPALLLVQFHYQIVDILDRSCQPLFSGPCVPAAPGQHSQLLAFVSTAVTGTSACCRSRIQETELDRPAADRLASDVRSAGRHRLRDIAEAQAEAVTEPKRVTDFIAGKRWRLHETGFTKMISASSLRPTLPETFPRLPDNTDDIGLTALTALSGP